MNFRKIRKNSIRSKTAFRSYYEKIDAECLVGPTTNHHSPGLGRITFNSTLVFRDPEPPKIKIL